MQRKKIIIFVLSPLRKAYSMRSCRPFPCWLLPVFALSALGLAPAASAQNALSNPGFETGSLSPWQDVFSGSGGRENVAWHTTTDFVHSGQYAVTATGTRSLSQTFAPVTPQSITQFSFWAASPAFSGASSGFSITGTYNSPTQGQNQIFFFGSFFPGAQYQFYDFTTQLKSNLLGNSVLTGLQFNGGIDNFGGFKSPTLYLDDVTLSTNSSPVPEASTTVSLGLLLALGLGSLTLTARRKKAAR